jgi:hypothetical protein
MPGYPAAKEAQVLLDGRVSLLRTANLLVLFRLRSGELFLLGIEKVAANRRPEATKCPIPESFEIAVR